MYKVNERFRDFRVDVWWYGESHGQQCVWSTGRHKYLEHCFHALEVGFTLQDEKRKGMLGSRTIRSLCKTIQGIRGSYNLPHRESAEMILYCTDKETKAQYKIKHNQAQHIDRYPEVITQFKE